MGYKLLVPQLLLLALLSGLSVALFLDYTRQTAGLRSTLQQLEGATRVASLVTNIYESIAVEVLSYRIDRGAGRLDAVGISDSMASKELDGHARIITDTRERELLAALSEARQRIRQSRAGFVRAIDAGSERGIEAAFKRWQIHRRLLEANLEDFSTYSLNRFSAATEQVVRERAAVVRYLIYGFLASIAIAAGTFFYVRRALVRPLALLLREIGELGEGKLGTRIDAHLEKSPDEIGRLAKAFNAMAGEIERLQRGLEVRVEERTRELEAVNKELEAFAYSVSHDLRAPLRAIDGFSQALLEDYQEILDADGKDSLRRVRKASQRMAELIDDMLKLSRATRVELTVEPVDLSALAEEAVAALRYAEPSRDVVMSIERGVRCRGDARLLRSVMDNLLANAWKFTGKQAAPRVEFGAEQGVSEVICHVRDNGAGFDMAFAGGLFAPFQRLHQASEFPGNGIGLATVRRVVGRLGGRVWAEGAVGQGATFYFTLPAAPAPRNG